MKSKSDGKWIVLENGRQVSGPFDEAGGAEIDASSRRRKLLESQKAAVAGTPLTPVPLIEVKQILHG